MDRPKEFTRQLVVRVDEDTYKALATDAQEHGRTIAQSVRFKLREVPRLAAAG